MFPKPAGPEQHVIHVDQSNRDLVIQWTMRSWRRTGRTCEVAEHSGKGSSCGQHSFETVCDPNCHANPRCGITASVENGRIIKIEPGAFPLPEYDGRVCAMGMARLEQHYHKDRLRFPLRRLGERGQGQWERISWEEAFDWLAICLRKVADRYGSRSLAFFSGSGAAGVLTKGSTQRFAAAIGGTAHRAGGVDYGVPKGLEYMFGVPASTYFRPGGHEMADAVNSHMILLWGGNGADTRLVDFHFVTAAQQRGAKLVCIDPNRSATAQRADQWISPRPGTDGALALGLLNEIFGHGWQDDAFLRRHTNGPLLVRRDNGAFLRAADLIGGNAADYDGMGFIPRLCGGGRHWRHGGTLRYLSNCAR